MCWTEQFCKWHSLHFCFHLYHAGKLQTLDLLLRDLKTNAHRYSSLLLLILSVLTPPLCSYSSPPLSYSSSECWSSLRWPACWTSLRSSSTTMDTPTWGWMGPLQYKRDRLVLAEQQEWWWPESDLKKGKEVCVWGGGGGGKGKPRCTVHVQCLQWRSHYML